MAGPAQILVVAALWAAAAGALAGTGCAAEVPSTAAASPAGQADRPWGAPAGGMCASLALEGEAAVGGKMVLRLAIRSAAGAPLNLSSAKDAFGWVLVAQNVGGNRKAFYSAKVPLGEAIDWPAELSGDKVLASRPIDVSGATAYPSQVGRELLTAYLSGKADAALPAAAGRLAEVLTPGLAMARFTVCVPGGGKPLVVTSNAVDMIIAPPALDALSVEAREAFLKDLMGQFDRDPWSGQQAHDTCVRLGGGVVPLVVRAAFEGARPPHARLWLATTLADIADQRCVDALIRLLDDPMAGVRHVVAYHGPKQKSDRLDKALVAKVRASGDGALAAWTLLGFMVHRGEVPPEAVEAGLESADPRARAAAAETLARHASEFNIGRLAALLEDKDERVRATAAAMLGKSGNASALVCGGLVKALDLGGETARQRICAALSALTGQDVPYDLKADSDARQKTLAWWKQWWAGQGARQ